jgi:hypothetical protein
MELETLLTYLAIELYLCISICHFIIFSAVAHLADLTVKAYPPRQRNEITDEHKGFLKRFYWSLAWPAFIVSDIVKYLMSKLKKSE